MLSRQLKTVLIFLFLCSAQKLIAMYNGNPSSPMMPEVGVLFTHSWFSLKAGYEFDHAFERKLTMESHHVHATDNQSTSRGQFGVLTMIFSDRAEFYSGLGSLKSTYSQHVHEDRIHYHTDRDFAWSVGGRALFAYWGDVQFGLSASYLHFFPDIHSISVNGTPVSKEQAELQYHEWQVGAGISYHIWWLFPYAGFVYSNAKAEFLHLKSLEFFFPQEHFMLESKNHYGLMVGLGIAPEIGFAINAEGRFFDETAFTISADVRF